MGNKVYEIVTARIIEKIENAIKTGTGAPWQQPWESSGAPVNYITQKAYRGVNLWLLDSGEYLTWTQLCDLQKHSPELKLQKGSKSHLVVYFSFTKHTKDVINHTSGQIEQKEVKTPFLRYYKVFDIKDVDGLESKRQQVKYEHSSIEEAETIVNGYFDREDGLKLTFNNGERACYRPMLDEVSVPSMEHYRNHTEYYSTLFHEMTHSTGHPKRLNRIKAPAFFGDEAYSKEELVAELGASMLCASCGIDNSEAAENSVAYLQNWLEALKNDVTLIVSASAKAQKASDFILGTAHESEEQ